MKIWIKVDPATEKITDLKWKTFGCGSAIASTSMMSVMATENGGITLDEARKLRPQNIMERLGGLPARKVHCSVLGDKALRAAINDWYRKAEKTDKIEVEQGRVIDKILKITDHDIEEAVLDGADTLEKVQGYADEVVCLEAPMDFRAVGQFYAEFPQVEDEEVIEILRAGTA